MCSSDKTLRVWDPPAGGDALHVLEGHSKLITSVTAFVTADGEPWVVSCFNDKTLLVWNPIAGGPAHRTLECHSEVVDGVTTCQLA